MISAKKTFLWAVLAATIAAAQPTTISPQDYVSRMSVGIDVGWASFQKSINAYSAREPADFRAAGFDHVRIRTGRPATPDFLDYLERVVRDSLAVGLTPVLAYGPNLNRDPSPAAVERAVAWWRAVADRFADYPPQLSFDLFIEPGKQMNDHLNVLRDYYRRALATVRQTNPTRVVFLAPRRAAHPEFLPELDDLFAADGYLAAETHFYAAGPSKKRERRLWTTGTAAEKALIERQIGYAVEWRERTGVPVWIGAWMPGNYNKGNDYTPAEQVVFARFMACRLRAARLPYAVNADQKFYDINRKTWIPEMWPVVREVTNPRCP